MMKIRHYKKYDLELGLLGLPGQGNARQAELSQGTKNTDRGKTGEKTTTTFQNVHDQSLSCLNWNELAVPNVRNIAGNGRESRRPSAMALTVPVVASSDLLPEANRK